MNNQAAWQAIAEQGDRRNAVLYAWLRWLVLLEAGLFSLMAGQLFAHRLPDAVLWWAKLALLSNGASILLGVVALYGERALHQRLLEAQVASTLQSRLDGFVQAAPPMHVGNVPRVCVASERLCYAMFVVAMLSWMRVIWLF